jgi:hypothetical protein
MRLIIIFSFLTLLGCQTNQQAVKKADSYYELPKEKEISISYETKDVCSTYYFFAKDTLTPIIARVLSNDQAGHEKEVIYTSFESHVPATSLIFYDSLGKKSIEYYRIDEKGQHQTLTKTLHYYNEKAQLIQSISFDFKRRIKKDVDKGLGRPGGCIITEDDYEKQKSWALASVWNYKYDNLGRHIEKVAPVLNSTQDHYLYSYDSLGRLKEKRSLEANTIIWIENYAYHQNGYEFTRTWFEKDGTRGKEWNGSLTPVDTFRYKTDNFNNVTEELVIEEGGRQISKDYKFYDTQNRLRRHEIYNDTAKLIGYYVYDYIGNQRPVRKIFTVDPE